MWTGERPPARRRCDNRKNVALLAISVKAPPPVVGKLGQALTPRENFSVRVYRSLLVLVLLAGTVAASPSKPTVVLDPGHGGSNPGAQGATGIREKQITLTLANLVATRLREHGVTVTLTRTTDRTLTLRQRVEIANQLPADIFVSIHANASPTRVQRGYETYVLTAKGVDVDARALRSGATTPRPGV